MRSFYELFVCSFATKTAFSEHSHAKFRPRHATDTQTKAQYEPRATNEQSLRSYVCRHPKIHSAQIGHRPASARSTFVPLPICSLGLSARKAIHQNSAQLSRSKRSGLLSFSHSSGTYKINGSRNVFGKAIWTLCKQKRNQKNICIKLFYQSLLSCATVCGYATFQTLNSES